MTFEIEGQEVTTHEDFHKHLKETFQFHDWYGENWNAYFELMIDLDWHQFTGIFIVIKDAEHLLHHDNESKNTFFRTQNLIATTWATGKQINENLSNQSMPFYTLMISNDRHFTKQLPLLRSE